MGRGWGPGCSTSTARRASTPSPLRTHSSSPVARFSGRGCRGLRRWRWRANRRLTGFVGDSLSSGPVAEELSRMPFDALVIKGKASGPVFLHIEDESVRVLDAASLVWPVCPGDGNEDNAQSSGSADAKVRGHRSGGRGAGQVCLYQQRGSAGG